MRIFFDPKAQKELFKFDKKVQDKFREVFKAVENEEMLPSHLTRSINKQVFEYRIKYNTNTYRAIAGEIKEGIVVVLFYKKKTQKLPLREKKTAIERLKNHL
jgi:phage-related protein